LLNGWIQATKNRKLFLGRDIMSFECEFWVMRFPPSKLALKATCFVLKILFAPVIASTQCTITNYRKAGSITKLPTPLGGRIFIIPIKHQNGAYIHLLGEHLENLIVSPEPKSFRMLVLLYYRY